MKKIAVVDDTLPIREFFNFLLTRKGYQCRCYENSRSFIDDCNNGFPDMLILDLMLPEMSGEGLLNWILRENPDQKILVYSARNAPEEIIRQFPDLSLKVLQKPSPVNIILETVKAILGE